MAYVGAVLAGSLIGMVDCQVRLRMDDPMPEGVAMRVTTFAGFRLFE